MERDEQCAADYSRNHRLHGLPHGGDEIRLLQRLLPDPQMRIRKRSGNLRRLSGGGRLPGRRCDFPARPRRARKSAISGNLLNLAHNRNRSGSISPRGGVLVSLRETHKMELLFPDHFRRAVFFGAFFERKSRKVPKRLFELSARNSFTTFCHQKVEPKVSAGHLRRERTKDVTERSRKIFAVCARSLRAFHPLSALFPSTVQCGGRGALRATLFTIGFLAGRRPAVFRTVKMSDKERVARRTPGAIVRKAESFVIAQRGVRHVPEHFRRAVFFGSFFERKSRKVPKRLFELSARNSFTTFCHQKVEPKVSAGHLRRERTKDVTERSRKIFAVCARSLRAFHPLSALFPSTVQCGVLGALRATLFRIAFRASFHCARNDKYSSVIRRRNPQRIPT